jgi:hypothetical protein
MEQLIKRYLSNELWIFVGTPLVGVRCHPQLDIGKIFPYIITQVKRFEVTRNNNYHIVEKQRTQQKGVTP